MPLYTYTCISRQGEWLDGRYEAPDVQALEKALEENGLILVTWKEVGEAPLASSTDSKPATPNSRTISAEEGRSRWAAAPASQRLVPKIETLAAMLPPVPSFGILRWIAAHSFGAVTNSRDAFLVLAVCAGFLASAVHIVRHGFTLAPSALPQPLTLPQEKQPDMSVKKINGQRRRTKTYPLAKVRATLAKTALDHVMRQSSLTTELTTSADNALEIKATPLDLELVDTLIQAIDKDYGESTDYQVFIKMVDQMATVRDQWMSVPHPVPPPTPEEQKQDEMEQALSQEPAP